jgi:chitodextrinase
MISVLGLFAQTNASIKSSGLWDNHDFYDTTAKIGVKAGVPYSTDTDTKRRIASGTPLEGGVPSDYKTKTNVKRVKRVMSEDSFDDDLFPEKKSIYTYDGFLKAVSMYPKFCDEDDLDNYTADEACKRELATLFAHFA